MAYRAETGHRSDEHEDPLLVEAEQVFKRIATKGKAPKTLIMSTLGVDEAALANLVVKNLQGDVKLSEWMAFCRSVHDEKESVQTGSGGEWLRTLEGPC